MKPMETVRIGQVSVTLKRVDDKGAELWVRVASDDYIDRTLTPAPIPLDKALIPLSMWHAFEMLLSIVGDVDKLQALLFRDADWPRPTGDERTDLIAQRDAALEKLNMAMNAVMAMTRKVKG